jgi:putative nucleotidyltransferase with HDIG domain
MAFWQKRAGDAAAPAAAPSPAPAAATAAGRPAETPRAAMEAALRRLAATRAQALVARADALTAASDAPRLLESVTQAERYDIKPMPATVARALRLTADPDSSMRDLVDIFESDPGLAQELIRVADSAYYRRPGAVITSILDAAQRIGMSGLQSVLMGHLVHSALCRPGGAYEPIAEQVTQHGMRVATIARRIAPAFATDPETAYSLGLLHDVGKLVLFDAVSTLRAQLRREVRMPLPFVRAALRELHEPLGGLAALRWGLPPQHARAIARHHRQPAPEQLEPLIELLHIAERADLARVRHEALDLRLWWREGTLRSDAGTVEPLVVRALAELDAG